MDNIASDRDESDVEELPEVDISVLFVQPYMFEPTKSSENGTVESESESEDEGSNSDNNGSSQEDGESVSDVDEVDVW